MSLIITCGFQPVNLNGFRPSSISKGKKLVYSGHVGNVREVIQNGKSFITGSILRETPGAVSTRKKENFYNATVELDPFRNVENTLCICLGGRGKCKHSAAICVFVNEENTLSKTSAPMVWNRPPDSQLKKYCSKGSLIKSMFPSQKGNIPQEVYHFQDIKYIFENEDHLKENSDLIRYAKKAQELEAQQEHRRLVQEEKNQKNRQLVEGLFQLQLQQFNTYHSYSSCVEGSSGLKFSKTKCPESCEKYFAEKVLVTESDWKEICFQSIEQSNTVVWFDQRRFRITASSKAHKILTRQNYDDFPSLASSLAQEKYQGRLTPAMEYGLSMESFARNSFQEKKSLIVHQVGLVVCFRQPYLACSPDGILFNGTEWELVEIKCPFTCKDLNIVNFDDCTCNVPYLKFNDRKVDLKQNHQYYTQVQLSLYVTGIRLCHFVIYSSAQMVCLKIERNEEFLSHLVRKLDYFYYNHLIYLFATEG